MCSINFNHYGAPKFWYGVSRSDYRKFEAFVRNRMPERFIECDQLLRHKTVVINPYFLKTWLPDIRIVKLANKTHTKAWGVHHNAFVSLPLRVQLWIQHR